MVLQAALIGTNQALTGMSARITATQMAFTSLVTAFAGASAISAGVAQMEAAVSTGMASVTASMTVGMLMVTTSVRTGMTQTQAATTAGMVQIVTITTTSTSRMVAVFISSGARIVASSRSTASGIQSAFAGVNLYSAGYNMMAGLESGIRAKGAAAVAAARSIAQQAAAAVNSALQIHSPSRVMMKSGQYVDEGLAAGMEKNSGLVKSAAVSSLAQPVTETNLQTKSIETPETIVTRSAVLGETIGTLSGEGIRTRNQTGDTNKNPTFVFSPTYHFEGEAPSKEDIVEANSMSQKEFEKMMKEYLRKNKRVSFA